MTAPKFAQELPPVTGPGTHSRDRFDEEAKARREQREVDRTLADSDPFPAQFFGKCRECDGKISPGEEITRHPDGSYGHALAALCDAPELPPIGPRERLCISCFCYHAGECA